LTFNECSRNPIIFVTPRLTSLRKQQHHIENIGSIRSKLGLVVFGYLQWVRRSIDADVWAVRDDSRNRWRPNQEFLDVFYRDAPIVLVEETSSEEESSDDAIDSDSGSYSDGSGSESGDRPDSNTDGAVDPTCTVM